VPDFFEEIIKRPVPIDIRVLKSLKQSAMKLDIYCWLTHRMSYLKHASEIDWKLLHLQFGSGYTRERDFKKAFLEHLKGVLLFYDADVEEGKKGLILKPSPTHIN
jgi:replication initiator protein